MSKKSTQHDKIEAAARAICEARSSWPWPLNPPKERTGCYRENCGLNGLQPVDFRGFRDSFGNGKSLIKIDCDICGRRFVGVLVEKGADAK